MKLIRSRPKGCQVMLTVPKKIADLLPEQQEFEAELTEEGLLYRPIEQVAPPKIPSWIKK